MSDFITLTCPNCSAKLEITDDMDRFACKFCGTEHIVRRTGSVISLKPVVEGLAKVQGGVDKTASELAIVRLTGEIRSLEKQVAKVQGDAEHHLTLCVSSLALDEYGYFKWCVPRYVAPFLTMPLVLYVFWTSLAVVLFSGALSTLGEDLFPDFRLAVMCIALPLFLLAALYIWMQTLSWRAALNERYVKEQKTIYRECEETERKLRHQLQDKQRQLQKHRDIVSRFD